MKSRLNRRKWLQLGIGIAAGSATGFAPIPLKDNCNTTPAAELGPFPPMKSRKQPDHDIDLTMVKGQNNVATGQIIEVVGKILDERCNPVEGAIIELWQANHYGKYNHEYDTQGQHDPNFQGWGQAITKSDGKYRFKTIVPGLYSGRTRHIHFKVSKRGYHELVTQLYFDGEERNNTDGLYNDLTHEEQLQVTRKIDRTKKIPAMEFDMHIKMVKEGTVSAKVLTSYVGRYTFAYAGTIVEEMINELYPKQESIITIDITNDAEQLFVQLPFTPRMEMYWKAKDYFDGSEFFRMELRFLRGEDGKVNALTMNWGEMGEIVANKA
jgi:protocatechuate 3,4-dioxygenase beta subunit